MGELSSGQKLALDQLTEIAARSDGALEIMGTPEKSDGGTYIRVNLSLATGHYRTGTDNGFVFRDRERMFIVVYRDFPFEKPELYFSHSRFAGKPHVQWGRYVCLYQSPETEYQPADGVFGFFERVDQWMAAAGSGQLDPDDAPLHPPVAYAKSRTKFVIKADTPPEQENETYWIGRVNLKKVRDDRYDVVSWTHLDDWLDTNPGHPVAAAFIVKQPLATEYPTRAYDLIKLVEAAGLGFEMLWRMLRLFALLAPEGEPAHMVLGAPMRRKAEGSPLRPHLTIWEIAPEPLAALRAYIRSNNEDEASRDEVVKWLVESELTWCYVMEDRSEIVYRRDGGALASKLAGKRVLLLGAGALGSAVAENVVRANAARLHLVDKTVVKPGILVRQRYSDADIGRAKASALREHLIGLGLSCTVTAEVLDLSKEALAHFSPEEWDIVIDTTASVAVGHRMERELKDQILPIPLISLSVSAAAQHGSVAVKMPGYAGGVHQIARQGKLAAFASSADHPLVKAFWPQRKDVKVFQPEPGCSEPTFIGSAADIDHHAAGLLNVGLRRVESLPPDAASMDLIAASWLEEAQRPGGHLHYAFEGYAGFPELHHGYRVLRSDEAARGMAAELKRIARTRSDKMETGGLVFGEIDDSHQHIWIDSVSGPPPDSQASAEQFLCGTSGTSQLAASRALVSGQSSRFIGIWHTHPISRGHPSEDDLKAMVQLLHFQEYTPRQVVMLIVGFAASAPVENYYLFRRSEFTVVTLEQLAEKAVA
jgi:proteasome lid subunit RPN8/RPN11